MRTTLKKFYYSLQRNHQKEFKRLLASECNVSSRSVWYWIKGENFPKDEHLPIIANVVRRYKPKIEIVYYSNYANT